MTEVVAVNKIASKEKITKYTINNTNKIIEVSIELSSDKGEVLKNEHYTFNNEDFKESLTAEELWILIDKKRSAN